MFKLLTFSDFKCKTSKKAKNSVYIPLSTVHIHSITDKASSANVLKLIGFLL